MIVPCIMSYLPTSKPLSFLYALCSFDWGEFGQGDSVYFHGIGIMMGMRGEMGLGGNSSLSKDKDSHLLGVEDLQLINPSLDGGGDSGHGEDHISDFLI